MSFIASLGDWLRKVTRSFASASISGQNIILTRHNGDTVTLTTQDTTYSDATQSAHGLMSVNDKKKLDGITAGAEPNQNAFASVLIGDTNVAADAKNDTLTLVAGNNITLTPDATNDKITIVAKDTVTTVSTTGSGNAITSITANNGALTVKKDSTFSLSNHTHSYLPLSGGTLTGTLNIQPKGSGYSYSEGIRLHKAPNNWATLVLGCDAGTTSGAPSVNGGWFIGQNTSNQLVIGNVDSSTNNASIWINTNKQVTFNAQINAPSFNGYTIEKSVPSNAVFTDTTYPAFSTSNTIGEGGYRDAMVMYDQGTSNRASVLRVTNGNGFHEILIGVNNESDGAPNGLSVRSTNGTITASLSGTLTVNGIKIGTGNIGSATKPVYINAGTITAVPTEIGMSSGTTYTMYTTQCAGYVTANQKSLYFTIPIQRMFPDIAWNARNPVINLSLVTIYKAAGGTINGLTGATVEGGYCAGGIRIHISYANALSITNNSAVVVTIQGTIKFN